MTTTNQHNETSTQSLNPSIKNQVLEAMHSGGELYPTSQEQDNSALFSRMQPSIRNLEVAILANDKPIIAPNAFKPLSQPAIPWYNNTTEPNGRPEQLASANVIGTDEQLSALLNSNSKQDWMYSTSEETKDYVDKLHSAVVPTDEAHKDPNLLISGLKETNKVTHAVANSASRMNVGSPLTTEQAARLEAARKTLEGLQHAA